MSPIATHVFHSCLLYGTLHITERMRSVCVPTVHLNTPLVPFTEPCEKVSFNSNLFDIHRERFRNFQKFPQISRNFHNLTLTETTSLHVGNDSDVLLSGIDVGRRGLFGEGLSALNGAADEAEAEARPVLDVDPDRDRVAARRLSQRPPQSLLVLLKENALRSRECRAVRSFVIHESQPANLDAAFRFGEILAVGLGRLAATLHKILSHSFRTTSTVANVRQSRRDMTESRGKEPPSR